MTTCLWRAKYHEYLFCYMFAVAKVSTVYNIGKNVLSMRIVTIQAASQTTSVSMGNALSTGTKHLAKEKCFTI